MVRLVYFDKGAAECDFLVLFSTLQYKSIREPSDTCISARLYGCVIFTNILIRAVTAQVAGAFFTTRVNKHLDLDVLRIRKVNIIPVRRVKCVKIRRSFFIIIKIGSQQIRVLILIYECGNRVIQLLREIDVKFSLNLFFRQQT